jgi:hypothetical protein
MTITENAWMNAADVSLPDFEAVVTQETDLNDFSLAASVDKGVLIYDCAQLNFADLFQRRQLEAELSRALDSGPGVYVLKGAYSDTSVIDQATQAFMDILETTSGKLVPMVEFGTPNKNWPLPHLKCSRDTTQTKR